MVCFRCGKSNPGVDLVCADCGIPLHSYFASGRGRASTGLEPNKAALLSYLLFWLSGLIFYFLESDKYVRFHALQSILTFGVVHLALLLISLLRLAVDWGFLGLLSTLLLIGSLILWVLMMVKASEGEKFFLPVVGDIAEKYQ